MKNFKIALLLLLGIEKETFSKIFGGISLKTIW